MNDAAQMWDERYRESQRMWTREPNPTLIEYASRLTPGSALDVGCGEGGDSLWLASRGWEVTGVDISQVAIDRARELASEQGWKIEFRQADLVIEPESRTYDLVTSHFMHLPQAPRTTLFAGLLRAVTPGGHLLIVGHDPSDISSGAHRPREPGFFYSTDDLRALFDASWKVVPADTRPRDSVRHADAKVTVNDAILLARRSR